MIVGNVVGGDGVKLDTTVSKVGYAADAKATNDKIIAARNACKEDIPKEATLIVNKLLKDKNFFVNDFCPNIYVRSNGIADASGNIRDYNKTISVLKNLGVKKISLLLSIESFENGRFQLGTNVSYVDVVNRIHANDIAIKSVRFSNTGYGKDKMANENALNNLANSVPLILKELGISSEIEFVGILNENKEVYLNNSLIDATVNCINQIKLEGYKVAFTDIRSIIMQLDNKIMQALDYVGINAYPRGFIGDIKNADYNTVYNSICDFDLLMYLSIIKSRGVNVFISEIGCSNTDDALFDPTGGHNGNYVGMQYIEMYFQAFKQYFSDYNLHTILDSFNPWYTEVWERSENLNDIFRK